MADDKAIQFARICPPIRSVGGDGSSWPGHQFSASPPKTMSSLAMKGKIRKEISISALSGGLSNSLTPTFCSSSLSSFPPDETIELFLTYSIPEQLGKNHTQERPLIFFQVFRFLRFDIGNFGRGSSSSSSTSFKYFKTNCASQGKQDIVAASDGTGRQDYLQNRIDSR